MNKILSQTSKCTLLLVATILLLSLVSAETACDKNLLTINENQTYQSLICHNLGNDTIYLNFDSSKILVSPNYILSDGNPNITVTSSPGLSSGDYSTSLTFSDSSPAINVNINIPTQQEEEPPINYPIIVFPTAKIVNVQQGQQKAQNIQIIVPQNYPRTITIQDVSADPDLSVAQFGDLNLGQVAPGQTLNIPLIINGENAQVGFYDTIITILATDSLGQVQLSPVSLRITVTAGVTSGNGTLSKPDCSLSTKDLTLNSTATFTCSNVVSSIDVSPLYNEYLEGIDATLTQNGIYTYTFKPIKIGNTRFMATFLKGYSSIFIPFSEEIRIASTTGAVSGTDLSLSFYQFDSKKELNELLPGLTNILVKDNLTSSIINDYQVFLNGQQTNNSFNLEANKPYELIVNSAGYSTSTVNFSINPNYIEISLNPSSGWVEGNTIVINSTPENVSLFLDGIKIDSLSILPSAGEHILEAIAEGYINTKINITIAESVKILSALDEFKKGEQETIVLSKNATWQVLYSKDASSQYNPIFSGNGDTITFTPEKSGLYEVIADGKIFATKEIKGFNWNTKWLFLPWYIWILFIVVLIIVIAISRSNGGSSLGVGQAGFKDYGVQQG